MAVLDALAVLAVNLLQALWRASWQGGLLLALVYVSCRLMERRLPANFRNWMWRAVYLKMLFGLAITASVSLPILPAASPSLDSTVPETISLPVTAGVASATPAQAALLLPSPGRTVPNQWSFPWQSTLAIVYGIGIVICAKQVVEAGARTYRIRRRAVHLTSADEAEVTELFPELCKRIGLHSVPALLRSTEINVPVYISGAVILPAKAAYSGEDLRLILAHELAHARRQDLLWEWPGVLTQVIFFFHPLVLLARREERLAREAAADSLALQVTQASVLAYGKLLLSISLASGPGPEPPLAGAIGVMQRGAPLRRRLLLLKEVSVMSSLVHSRKSRAFVVAAVIVGAVGLVPWQITRAASDPMGFSVPPVTPSALRDPVTGQLHLRNIAGIPFLTLSGALGLTSSQEAQIKHVQKQVSEQLMENLLQQVQQRRQLIATYLPSVRLTEYGPADQSEWATASQELQRTRKEDWEKYSRAMQQTIETGKENTERLEATASRDLLSVLSSKQSQMLPGLLHEVNSLQAVSIPVALYDELKLNQDQKDRIAAIARAAAKRRSQALTASRAALDDSRGTTSSTRNSTQNNQIAREVRRSLITMNQVREQARSEAMRLLSQKQRNTLTAYFQAHSPHP